MRASRSPLPALAGVVALTSTLAACGQVSSSNVTGSSSPPVTQAGTGRLQSSELLAGSAPQDGPTKLTFVPGLGVVRGTPEALEGLSSPLVPTAGPSRTVKACRIALEQSAAPLGARQVEVVAAGPRQRRPGGGFVAPVEVRILYRRTLVYEVRHTVLSCEVDAQGKVVQARTLSPPANYRQIVWAGMRDFTRDPADVRRIEIGQPRPSASGWHACAKFSRGIEGPPSVGQTPTVFVLQDGVVLDLRRAEPSDCRGQRYTPLREGSDPTSAS